jgi:hypothetical protein
MARMYVAQVTDMIRNEPYAMNEPSPPPQHLRHERLLTNQLVLFIASAMAVEKPAPRVLGHLQQRIDAHTEPQYGHAGCAALQQLAHKWARKCREQALKYWYGSI